MAEAEQQTVMLEEVSLGDSAEIVTVTEANLVEESETNDDILQQALVETTDVFDQNVVTYTTENGKDLDDETGGTVPVPVVTSNGGETYTVVGTVADHQVMTTQPTVGQSLLKPDALQVVATPVQQPVTQVIVTEPTPILGSDGQPLGSSQNPIRIVQQGNQYTSLQHLSKEQLQQIMQVVQEQQVSKVTSGASGSTTIYNPQTQTRIVYRVIYPSELHKSKFGSEDGSTQVILSNGQLNTTPSLPKRVYKKRHRDDEDKTEGPELSKAKKKKVPTATLR